MRKQHLQFYAVLLSLLLMTCMLVYAAEDREQITEIPLTFEYSFETGSSSGDVYVSTGSYQFSVDDVEITNEDDDWRSGDRPRIKVYLSAHNNYYFSTTKESSFTFSGDDADFVSASVKESKSVMIVTVKLDELESGDLTVTDLEWDGDSGTGTWEEHKDAKYYQVRLYRNGSSVTSAHTTYDTSYDFSNSISKSGDYTFRVRAVDYNSDRGSWEESDDWYVSGSMARDFDDNSSPSSNSGGPGTSSGSTSSGGPGTSIPNRNSSYWCLDHVGWWYQNSNGTYPVNEWMFINQKWYFFDHTGYMKTGWILWKNLWYYCDSSGAMLTNATTPDGYRVDGNGVWIQ